MKMALRKCIIKEWDRQKDVWNSFALQNIKTNGRRRFNFTFCCSSRCCRKFTKSNWDASFRFGNRFAEVKQNNEKRNAFPTYDEKRLLGCEKKYSFSLRLSLSLSDTKSVDIEMKISILFLDNCHNSFCLKTQQISSAESAIYLRLRI